jgi:hypothetical protein
VSVGDTGESELDKLGATDLSADAGVHDSDPGESSRQQKKGRSSKSSSKKDNHEGKGKGKLRDAIFQGRSRKQPVRHQLVMVMIKLIVMTINVQVVELVQKKSTVNNR